MANARTRSPELPPLRVNEDEAFSLTKYLLKMFRPIFHWIDSLFPRIEAHNGFDWAIALKLTGWVVIAIIVIAAIALTLQWLDNRRPRDAKSSPSSRLEFTPIGPHPWEAELRAAVESGDFARAARVRWRIFLDRKKRPASLTPREYFGSREPRLEIKAYRVMFRDGKVPAADFHEWQAMLEGLEAAP